MRRTWMKHFDNERGATLAIVAVSLVMLMSCAAIAIDLGMLYNARSEAQRAADAAALAGASVWMPPFPPATEETAEARNRARQYAALNPVSGTVVNLQDEDIEVFPDVGRVRVTVRREGIPLWFARIMGLNTGTVAARATAAVQRSGTVECVRPIGFADLWHERSGSAERYSNRLPTQPPCAWGSTLCDYYHPEETGRGQWWRNPDMPRPDGKGRTEPPALRDDVGRLLKFDLNTQSIGETDPERLYRFRYYPMRTPGCNGGSCWRQGLAGEICTGRISVGDMIFTESGVQVGPTDQGFQAAKDADPNAYWDTASNSVKGSRYPLGCTGTACTGDKSPRIFNVAMVDPASRIVANASTAFPIQNFGAFFLVDWKASGNESWVEVRWMKPKAVADNCAARGNCRANLTIPLRLVE